MFFKFPIVIKEINDIYRVKVISPHIIYTGCNYSSMPGLKIMHARKSLAPGKQLLPYKILSRRAIETEN